MPNNNGLFKGLFSKEMNQAMIAELKAKRRILSQQIDDIDDMLEKFQGTDIKSPELKPSGTEGHPPVNEKKQYAKRRVYKQKRGTPVKGLYKEIVKVPDESNIPLTRKEISSLVGVGRGVMRKSKALVTINSSVSS